MIHQENIIMKFTRRTSLALLASAASAPYIRLETFAQVTVAKSP
jgi:hypothetical protein